MVTTETYEYIVNNSGDFITLINREYRYEIVNDAYCRNIDKGKDSIVGKTVEEIWGESKFQGEIKGHLDAAFAGSEEHYIDTFKFGLNERYMHVSLYPYSEREDIEVSHVLVFSHDITKLGEIESKLINYEYRDPVTGLFNRRSLDIILDMELEKARRSKNEKLRAILFISLENIDRINLSLGHNISDILIENTGLRIQETVRSSDYVFRFEGNELTVMLTNVFSHTDIAKAAEKISVAISTPYRFRENDIFIQGRIGVAVFPDDGDDRDTIIKNAISAMNESRNQKKSYVLYDSSMHERAMQRISLEGQITQAFEQKQFELYYQPIVNRDGAIKGAESLIRWHHPTRNLVNPGEFIPIAEETGLIVSIGRWALYTACRQLSAWPENEDFYLSVNISALEFSDPEFISVVEGALKSAGITNTGKLKLEITESASMVDPTKTIERMNDLKKSGIEILIDDFGTGHSSLGYLRNLPANTLKIDRMFISNMEQDDDDRTFLTAIVNLIKSRGKRIIVEGVSTRRQFEFLGWINCDFMQGYYISKPIPAADFSKLLQTGTIPLQS